MNPRTKRQLLDLLKEFDGLTLDGAKGLKNPVTNLEYGPSIFKVAHDPLIHDEKKACPHCRAISIVAELRELVEKA